jgi:hypothetical protein
MKQLRFVIIFSSPKELHLFSKGNRNVRTRVVYFLSRFGYSKHLTEWLLLMYHNKALEANCFISRHVFVERCLVKLDQHQLVGDNGSCHLKKTKSLFFKCLR